MISKRYTVIVIGLLAVLLIAAVAVTAGCTSQGTPQPGTYTVTTSTQPAPVSKSASIEVYASAPKRLYLVEGGCSYETTVEVLNAGQTDYANVAIRLDLVEGLLGSVRDTQNLPITRIVHGDRKVFTITFSGECDKEYRVRSEVS